MVVVTRAPWDEHARLHLPASLAPLSAGQENGLRSSLRDLLGGGGQKEVLWASQKITVEVVVQRAGGESTPVSAAPPAAAAVSNPATTAAATVPAGAAGTGNRAESLDDSDLTWEERQDIYSETRGHGQYGPGKIHPSRYIIYASYLPDDTWRAPSFNKTHYVVSDKIGEISTKYKYRLIYFGSGQQQARDLSDKTMWGEYKEVPRFPGGINPPWCWRDNLFSRTGWWKDPRMILKIGEGSYRINPYLKPGEVR